MSRLFTFGCSFTKYCWPTWADFLGLEYDFSENWGCPGIGNVGIAQRIAECHSKYKFNSSDTIVIQWSSHLRNDYHRFRSPPMGKDALTGWKTKGSIFNYMNADLYDKKWVINFFDEQSFVMYSLNAMVQTQELLKSIGCTWRMTTIGDFEKLGNDFFDAGGYKENLESGKHIWTDYPEFNHYKSIWTDHQDNWLTPIGKYAWQRPQQLYTWNDPNRENLPWTDPHPSTNLHLAWLQDSLKPSLGKTTSISTAQQTWIDQAAELRTHSNNLEEFSFLAVKTISHWDNSYKGY